MFPVGEQKRDIDSFGLKVESHRQTMGEIGGRQERQNTLMQNQGTQIQNQSWDQNKPACVHCDTLCPLYFFIAYYMCNKI